MFEDPTTTAVVISAGSIILSIGIAWGNLRSQMKNLSDRFTVTDDRLDSHSKRLNQQGQRIAHLEGATPHPREMP